MTRSWGGPHAESLPKLGNRNCSIAILDPSSQIPPLATPTADEADPEMTTRGQFLSP